MKATCIAAAATAIILGIAATTLPAFATQTGRTASDRPPEARAVSKRDVARKVAIPFRTGIDEDALACTQWHVTSTPFDASALGCVRERLYALCADDGRDRVVPRLAEYLRTSSFNVIRALSRYNLVNDEQNESLCDVDGRGRGLLIAFTQGKKPPGSPTTEQNPDRLLKSITRDDGSIDAGAYARALDERLAIVEATRTAPDALAGLPMSTEIADPQMQGNRKTAGLPIDAGGWTNLTGYLHPVGRVNDLLIDPAGTPDARTMWAGTDGGGIWKSTNSGAAWTPINDKLGSLVIGKILRSAVNPQVMYASTNPLGSHSMSPYGIIKSTDGGVTWNQLAQTNPDSNADFLYVSHLAIHPLGAGAHDVLLAATNRFQYNNGQYQGGVYQSNDSGATWTKISADIAASFVMFHPSSGERAYALMNGSVFVSSNGAFGASPTSSVVSNTTSAYTKLAWAASNPSVLYALAKVDLSPGQDVTRLFRSSTGGLSWSPVLMSTSIYNTGRSLLNFTGAVWVDPTNANRVAAAEVWAGVTADATTANASSGWKRTSTGWADFHGIVHDPGYNGSSNKILYKMDDGGLYRYSDVDAIDFAPNAAILSFGMTISQVYSVAGRGGNVIFGAQDVAPRTYRSVPADPPEKWRLISAPGGAWIGDGATTAASRTNPDVLYGSKQYLDIFRSDDGGMSGVSICGTSPNRITEGRCGFNSDAAFIAPFVLDPSNETTLWAGGNSLWRTLNATASPPVWVKAHTLFFLNWVTAIGVAPGDSNTVWIGYGGFGTDLFKSVNATANPPTFTLVPAKGLPPIREITRIMIDRANTQNVWVAVTIDGVSGPRLFFTNNGGATFTPVNGLPQTTVYALAQHPANPAWIYAGTLVGLFASQNSGGNWGATNEGPANVAVRDLNWYSESGDSAVLLAATFGRGVWKATVVSTTPVLTVTRTGAGTVSSVPPGIACGGDCSESYGGPTSVTLTALADPGNVFTGWLGACTGTSPNCTFTVSAKTSVSATFAPGSTIPKVDVDANNPTKYDALTDGLMILRYLFGLTSVSNSAIGPNATRTTDPEILAHLTNVRPLLDVDGNGQAEALTDGLMILRYLFNLRGPSLINGAIGPGATRDQAQIESYLESILQ